jgi:hypothetical protein
VMNEKKELLTNFNFFFDPNNGNVEEIRSLCNFSLLKIVKIEPTHKVQRFFSERDPFNAHKTSLFISITSLIRME